MPQKISALFGLFSILAFSPTQAWANAYTGTISQDDQVLFFDFSLSSDTEVIARTWSFGGGVNSDSVAIAPGGFAPVLSLFGANGAQDLLALAEAGGAGSCGPGAQADPLPPVGTGYCWDVYIDQILPAGNYVFALSQDNNTPLGPSLADGFQQAGSGNFTGPMFLGDAGQCVMVGPVQRTCNWAVDFNISATYLTPEPSSLALLGLGLMLLARKPSKLGQDQESQG